MLNQKLLGLKWLLALVATLSMAGLPAQAAASSHKAHAKSAKSAKAGKGVSAGKTALAKGSKHGRAVKRVALHPELASPSFGHVSRDHVRIGGNLFLHLPEDCPRSMPHSDPSCTGPHRHLVGSKLPGPEIDADSAQD